jgi:hypothetical protein
VTPAAAASSLNLSRVSVETNVCMLAKLPLREGGRYPLRSLLGNWRGLVGVLRIPSGSTSCPTGEGGLLVAGAGQGIRPSISQCLVRPMTLVPSPVFSWICLSERSAFRRGAITIAVASISARLIAPRSRVFLVDALFSLTGVIRFFVSARGIVLCEMAFAVQELPIFRVFDCPVKRRANYSF